MTKLKQMLLRLINTVVGWLKDNPAFVISSSLIPFINVSSSTDPPPDITLASSGLWAFAIFALVLGYGIYYVRRNFDAGFHTAGENGSYVMFYFIVALATAISMLPVAVGVGARYFQVAILDCNNPRMVDYTWFVLDNVAKGVLLDFLESFDFDLYDPSCAPIKHNTITSIVKFSIRSFSTYILIWFAVRLWSSVKARLFGVAT